MMATKRARNSSVDMAAVDLWKRELGALKPRSFSRSLGASQDLVLRLQLYKKLEKQGCRVNAISFNADGNILISGSSDRKLILWNWVTGKANHVFESGLPNFVFQTKFLPYTGDRSIVTCATDGRVRHVEILEGGEVESTLLANHEGRVSRLAIEPGSPCILYTCGEDGLVQHFDLRTPIPADPMLFKCYVHNNGCIPVVLYAISIDPRRPNLFAVAGANNYTRLYDIRKYKNDGSSDCGQPVDCFCPPHLSYNKWVGVTGLAFSEQSELLVSYNKENIYLFKPDMGSGPSPVRSSEGSESNSSQSKSTPQVYKGHFNRGTVKGVSFFGPNSDYVTSGSDCGGMFIWKKKGGMLIRVMEADKSVVNYIESHPHSMVLASSGSDSDVKIWRPESIEKASLHVHGIRRRPKSRLRFDIIHTVESYEDDYEDLNKLDDSDEDDTMEYF